jgi:DNA-binding NarL/FixJ family response regulator
MINISIIDNDQTAIYGVRYLLRELSEPDIRIVNECRSVSELIEQSEGSVPDVVLLDVMLGAPTIPLVANVRQLQTWGTSVLAFSSDPGRREVIQAVRATKVNFMAKPGLTADLLSSSIRSTAAGEPVYSPLLGEALLLGDEGPELTDREKQVMRLCSMGLPNKNIARRLGITIDTLNKYISSIREKYRAAGRPVDDRIQMMWAALEDGLIEDVDEILKANDPEEG